MERSNCLGNEGGDNNNNSLSTGFLWPQRNYTCSFCKRQFNSAQALGGHMNVHRRDRAMLIQLPSWVFDFPNPNTNPNPNFPYSTASLSSSSSSSSSSTIKMLPAVNYPYNYSPPSLTTTFPSPSYHENEKSRLESPLSQDFAKKKMKKSMRSSNVLDEVEEFNNNIKGFSQKYEVEVLKKKNEVISLELEIGCKDPNEVLDLELRLGCF